MKPKLSVACASTYCRHQVVERERLEHGILGMNLGQDGNLAWIEQLSDKVTRAIQCAPFCFPLTFR